ncbi:hypothetical protein KVG29_09505 [Caldicoprobacter algeriensis]|uniref:uroporphyrinogen decarboxylase family protein n=1 Tax=Caldicoprobacter algeriensis TaxID=699281 RepID=UPI0020794DEF|nr:uroporphyrinogen decarboxylase family protein [Caldicoprobacter algeriensis]MCM8901456.1 hypothetical protein [Caldicoprobacter algeriensis]
MTPRERFLKVLNFEKPNDRLPMVEWAPWWNKTIERWNNEGLPTGMTWEESLRYFGLDPLLMINGSAISPECPRPSSHGAPIITDEKSYEEIKQYLYTDSIIDNIKRAAMGLKEKHDKGEIIIRLWLDGYFWFPRTLFGIENHFYAFYDYPELMYRINNDLTEFNIRVIEELFSILIPDMVGFAEDMSYNHGPMLSYKLFKEFLTPYYQRIIPLIKKYGVKVFVDSDGDITRMIPWLKEAGVEGVYPLERQAGVDILRIRREYPEFLMMGGYDKMVMSKSEKEMRAEFERLLPVMKSGGYIPSVDHQTPPEVSLDNYRMYVILFREYAERAVREDG